MFHDEEERALTVMKAGGLQPAPLICTGDDETRPSCLNHTDIRHARRGTQIADGDIGCVEQSSADGPEQEVAGGEEKRSARFRSVSLKVNRAVNEQGRVRRRQHHGDHHHRPHSSEKGEA